MKDRAKLNNFDPFQYKVGNAPSAAAAFEFLTQIIGHEQGFHTGMDVKMRGFKMVLFTATKSPKSHIQSLLTRATPFQPVWCRFEEDGWLFFGVF